MTQRVFALGLLLFAIVFISVGPKIVSALTQDNEELKTKVELQRSMITQLTLRVKELNDQLLNDQMLCTDRFAKREQEFLLMISSLESEAQKTNGRVVILEGKKHNNMFNEIQRPDGGNDGGSDNEGREKVAMMRVSEPIVETRTVIRTDNSNVLKMIKDMKKNIKGDK